MTKSDGRNKPVKEELKMNPLRSASRTLFLLVVATATTLDATAQQEPEPLYDGFLDTFKQEYFSLGMLLQTVADFQFDRTQVGNNGFSMANFRLLLSGEMDAGFGYVLATNFINSPAILDAMMYYRASSAVSLGVGQFKVPFSQEFLTYAGSIDFVNRSQAVTALAPGRQIGAQVAIEKPAGNFGLTIGAFNGNGLSANSNDNDDLLFAVRLSGVLEMEREGSQNGRFRYGVNVAHSNDDDLSFGNGLVSSFSGKRTLAGGDIRAEFGNLLFAGEVIHTSLSPEIGVARHPWGFHATAGLLFSPKIQGLVRWDGFDGDNFDGRSDLLVFGLNVWPTSVTEIQLNYIIDTEEAAVDHHQLLVNFQLGF